jgi:small redox-active disulfide protein 2
MKLEVFGGGCASCAELGASVREAVRDLAVDDVEVAEVHDRRELAARGVAATPALAIDGTVVVAGRVPDKAELMTLIATALV